MTDSCSRSLRGSGEGAAHFPNRFPEGWPCLIHWQRRPAGRPSAREAQRQGLLCACGSQWPRTAVTLGSRSLSLGSVRPPGGDGGLGLLQRGAHYSRELAPKHALNWGFQLRSSFWGAAPGFLIPASSGLQKKQLKPQGTQVVISEDVFCSWLKKSPSADKPSQPGAGPDPNMGLHNHREQQAQGTPTLPMDNQRPLGTRRCDAPRPPTAPPARERPESLCAKAQVLGQCAAPGLPAQLPWPCSHGASGPRPPVT